MNTANNNYDVNNNDLLLSDGGGGGGHKMNGFGSPSGGLKMLNAFLKDELREIRHAIEDEPLDDDDVDYHNSASSSGAKSESSTIEAQTVVIERQGGLANRFVLFLLVIWYVFSALTLYTNKFIVTTQKADSFIVGKLLLACLLALHY